MPKARVSDQWNIPDLMLPIIAAGESNEPEKRGRSNRCQLLRRHRFGHTLLYAYDQSPAYPKHDFLGCNHSHQTIASFFWEIGVIIPWHYILSRIN